MIGQASAPLGFVSVAVPGTTAVGFTAGIVSGTTHFVVPTGADIEVLMVAESGQVRWRDDGVAPTPTSGMLMEPTQAPFLYSGNPNAIQFIGVTGTVAVDASFYREVG